MPPLCFLVPAGAAIAAAVLDHLAHSSRCCGLFATHYHQLAAEHAADPQVAIMHMACAVAEQQQQGRGPSDDDGDVAEVTFLYKLTAGEELAVATGLSLLLQHVSPCALHMTTTCVA
jgi:hypothetical protein